MPAFLTKMRDIDNRGRIIRDQAQYVAGFHAQQPLARFEYGKRAQQPNSVQFLIPGHGSPDRKIRLRCPCAVCARLKLGEQLFVPRGKGRTCLNGWAQDNFQIRDDVLILLAEKLVCLSFCETRDLCRL